jgi:hypothetical protein
VEKEFRRRTEQVKAEYVAVDVSRFSPEVTAQRRRVKAPVRGQEGKLQFRSARVCVRARGRATLQSALA